MFSILTVLENKVKISLCFARVNIERGPTISSHCVHFFCGIFFSWEKKVNIRLCSGLRTLDISSHYVRFGGGDVFFQGYFSILTLWEKKVNIRLCCG